MFGNAAGVIGGSGVAVLTGALTRVQVMRGAGIGEKFSDAYAKYHAAAVTGLCPTYPLTETSFTRTGAIVSTTGGNAYVVAPDFARANPVQGVALAPALTNDCLKNAGILAGEELIITVSAGLTKTTTAVTLATFNLCNCGDRVYEVANATGSDGYAYYGALTGSGAARSVSVRGHHAAGAGAAVGLWDGATWTNATAVSDSYVRSHAVVTPANANQQWAIKIPAGATVRFLFGNNVVSPVQAPEIANLVVDAGAPMGTESINHGCLLSGSSGLVEAVVAPDGWSGTSDGQTRKVLTDTVSSGQHCVINNATQQVIVNDGTNEASQAIAEVDGTYQTIRTGWGPHGLVSDVAGVQNRDVYDGSLGFGSAMTESLNRWLRRLTVHRRER